MNIKKILFVFFSMNLMLLSACVLTKEKNINSNSEMYINQGTNGELTNDLSNVSSKNTDDYSNYEANKEMKKDEGQAMNLNLTDEISPTPTLMIRPESVLTLELKGEPVMEIDRASEWVEPGYDAFDSFDGDLNDKIVIESNLDIDITGEYEISYSVSNSAGDIIKKNRKIYVRMSKEDVESYESNGKVIYLTFDDGPNGKNTKKLLEILKKYDVKASFFVCQTGKLDLLQDEIADGHTVAMHTYTHDYEKVYSSEEAYFDDLYKIQNAIYDKIGLKPTLVRFPGGSSNTVSAKYKKGIMSDLVKSLSEKGYKYYDWNVSSGDGGGTKDTETIKKNVKKGVEKKSVSVVLMHDSHDYTVAAVEDIIIWGLENGYTFLPLSKYSITVHHYVNN